MTRQAPEYEYVDLMLDVKDGQIVGCELYGEGRQVEPLVEPILFKPLEGDAFPRGWKRIERAIKRAFRNFGRPHGEEESGK
jgi:hypothetical protein